MWVSSLQGLLPAAVLRPCALPWLHLAPLVLSSVRHTGLGVSGWSRTPLHLGAVGPGAQRVNPPGQHGRGRGSRSERESVTGEFAAVQLVLTLACTCQPSL